MTATHDDYTRNRSAGWHWAYSRLRNGAMSVTEILNAIDQGHPLLGFETGMRAALHEWQQEHEDTDLFGGRDHE